VITRELINKSKKGDEKSQYQLYRSCFDLLMPICLRYKTNEIDAVAAVNTAFLKIIQKIDSKKDVVDFIPWAKRLTINLLIDDYRKNKRRQKIQISVDPQELLMNGQQNTFNMAEVEMDAEQIIFYIQKLSEPGKTIFNLYSIEGFSHKEIANKLNITSENCRYHLHTARKILQAQLRHHVKQSKPA
jgi:RNA polymerase sigma-70 factor (ECF subfamily)